jgi:prepilin-type N-terminal cleavage/methylation domain-containing protein
MLRTRKSHGFTLIEVLLVLAIVGIISGIAIPVYLGQRRRARVIGDAMANARAISMLMEARKADNGSYGPASSTITWTGGSPSDATFLPGFTPAGNSKMDFAIAIGANGLTYTVTCTDPQSGGVTAYQTNERGEELVRLH